MVHHFHRNTEIISINDPTKKLVSCRELSRIDEVKIRSHPSATTEHLIDYIKCTFCETSDIVFYTKIKNDILKKLYTLQKIRKAISNIKEHDTKC